ARHARRRRNRLDSLFPQCVLGRREPRRRLQLPPADLAEPALRTRLRDVPLRRAGSGAHHLGEGAVVAVRSSKSGQTMAEYLVVLSLLAALGVRLMKLFTPSA